MALLEKGRICVLKKGRNAGKKVTVSGIDKNGKIIVERKGKKQKKVSALHLFPTEEIEK